MNEQARSIGSAVESPGRATLSLISHSLTGFHGKRACWLLAVALVSLLGIGLARAQDAPERLTIQLPDGGKMHFRAVYLGIDGQRLFDSRRITLGSRDMNPSYKERPTETRLSGGFVGRRNGKHDWLYYLGETEVQKRQWNAVMRWQDKAKGMTQRPKDDSRLPQTEVTIAEIYAFIEALNTWMLTGQRDRLPTYRGALAFCRLPTEAEWAFAARGGIEVIERNPDIFDRPHPYGDDLGDHEWYRGTSGNRVQESGRVAPNPLGLYDMLGNVEELTLSLFSPEYQQGRFGHFVICGGNFSLQASDLSAARRTEYLAHGKDGKPLRPAKVGFRLALSTRISDIQATPQELDAAFDAYAERMGLPRPGRVGEAEAAAKRKAEAAAKREAEAAAKREAEAAAKREAEAAAKREAEAAAKHEAEAAAKREAEAEAKREAEAAAKREAEAAAKREAEAAAKHEAEARTKVEAQKQPYSVKNAAIVNGVAISMEKFTKELNIQLNRVSQQGRQVTEDQLAALKNDILNSLIEREILYQQSRKVGIQITDKTVDDQLAGIKKRFPNETEYKNALSKMNLSEDEVKAQIKRGLFIKELINQQITSKLVLTDEESKAYYDKNPQLFKQPEQIKASHILIKVDAKADEAKKAEARKKIEEVQQKLKDGGDFADLAKEYSEGPSSIKGGDLGYFRRGQMVKPFEDAAFAMEPYEVSDIVETRFGYHLIKVYDKKQTLTDADVKDKIIQRMKQEKIEKEAVQYVEKLKKDAKIEKLL